MTICEIAPPYDHIWMSCCYLHQRRINQFQFLKPGETNCCKGPESVPNWSRTGGELVQNFSK